MMKQANTLTHADYSAGHPWYYYLGGEILSLKQIRETVRQRGFEGYARDEIRAADRRGEPQRSTILRSLKARFELDLKRDITIYRKRALELHRYRSAGMMPVDPRGCDAIHTSMSLKHNHLYNGFAHLLYIDDLMAQQGDLFSL